MIKDILNFKCVYKLSTESNTIIKFFDKCAVVSDINII